MLLIPVLSKISVIAKFILSKILCQKALPNSDVPVYWPNQLVLWSHTHTQDHLSSHSMIQDYLCFILVFASRFCLACCSILNNWSCLITSIYLQEFETPSNSLTCNQFRILSNLDLNSIGTYFETSGEHTPFNSTQVKSICSILNHE
jgi:hypothetical protein